MELHNFNFFMKTRPLIAPKPSQGVSFVGIKSLVVPNQALSIAEILERFTRGEPVNVGKQVTFHDSEDDIERISHQDIVERSEFVEKLKKVRSDFDLQEKRKAARERAAARKKVEDEIRTKLQAEQKPAEKA